jgi:hypothetical protein
MSKTYNEKQVETIIKLLQTNHENQMKELLTNLTEKIEDVNEIMLNSLTPPPIHTPNQKYLGKYLKYKSKYINLKNLLSQKD